MDLRETVGAVIAGAVSGVGLTLSLLCYADRLDETEVKARKMLELGRNAENLMWKASGHEPLGDEEFISVSQYKRVKYGKSLREANLLTHVR